MRTRGIENLTCVVCFESVYEAARLKGDSKKRKRTVACCQDLLLRILCRADSHQQFVQLQGWCHWSCSKATQTSTRDGIIRFQQGSGILGDAK